MLNDEQRGFIDSQFVMRMATSDHDGAPHVVALCFVLHGDNVYISGAPGAKRARNLAVNPRTALVVDAYDDDWDLIGSVLLIGQAIDLPLGEEHANACALLRARYPQFAKAGFPIEEWSVLAVRIERTVATGDLTPR